MTQVTPHEVMRGYVLPAMTEALDPHDWPLFPSAKIIIARDRDPAEPPAWARQLRENCTPHLEAALERAPLVALVVDARRALILPFEVIGAELAEEDGEDDPKEAAVVGEVPVEKIRHLPDEVRKLPKAVPG